PTCSSSAAAWPSPPSSICRSSSTPTGPPSPDPVTARRRRSGSPSSATAPASSASPTWPACRPDQAQRRSAPPVLGHEFDRELLEEQAHIGDDPARLGGPPVGELGHRRRVDVHADQRDRSGQ